MFREKSKTLLINLIARITEQQTKDPAARFAYFHTLNHHRQARLNILNKQGPNELDQVNIFLDMFEPKDRHPAANIMFHNAISFIGSSESYQLDIHLKQRPWHQYPEVMAITVTLPDNQTQTFERDA